MMTLYPIADQGTPGPNGWTHTGSGDFYEDVDESPDSPDAESMQYINPSGGELGKFVGFTVKTDGAAGITSGLLRIRGENTHPSAGFAVYAAVVYDNLNIRQFAGQRATFPAGAVIEIPLLPEVPTPYTYADFVTLLVSGLLDPETDPFLPDPVFRVDAVELILYQGDEPGGGGGPGPGGQVSRNAAFFSQMCGVP